MFNKISSKLRSSRGGSGNGQSNKGFAYGKMHKGGQTSLHSDILDKGEFERYSSTSWVDDDEPKQKEKSEILERNSSFNFAESIFPAPSVGRVKSIQSNDSNAGDHFSSGSLSPDHDERESKKSWGPSSSGQEEVINIGPPVLKDYEDAEEDFLGDFDEYYENLSVDNVRKEQYPKLDVQRLVYLDYAKCGLFSAYQVREHMRVLLEEGPYLALSENSLDPSNYVPDAQDRLFDLLNTDRASYSVIFTTSFAAGFRLMGKAFPFQRHAPLLISQDSHEAVRPLISCAVEKGAKPMLAPIRESDLCLNAMELRKLLSRSGGRNSRGLFAFPIQACASGIVHPLSWIAEAQQNGWQVLIDASTYLPAGVLDLGLYQPDFVLGSISHLLGYPSGFGFLLVRKRGHKVQPSGYDNNVKFIPVSDAGKGKNDERDCLILDEDNTLNSLAFAAVAAGFVHLNSVGYEAIVKRVKSLTAWVVQTLQSLKHKGSPGTPLTRVYGSPGLKNRGNVIAFAVLDSTGSAFPSDLVLKLAEKQNILLSGGHLSSPGVMNLLGSPSERVKDIGVFEGPPGGFTLVRVSLGPMSTFLDVYRLAEFLSRFRDEDYLSSEAMGFYEENPQG